MKLSVDRDLPVPLGVQLRGLIEYGIACGELLPGERLPSVRELADESSVAPMTVSQVYRELKDGGLIEARPGWAPSSATTARQPWPRSRLAALQRRMDGVIEDALALGLGPGELATMIARALLAAEPGARRNASDRDGRPVRGRDEGLCPRHRRAARWPRRGRADHGRRAR